MFDEDEEEEEQKRVEAAKAVRCRKASRDAIGDAVRSGRARSRAGIMWEECEIFKRVDKEKGKEGSLGCGGERMSDVVVGGMRVPIAIIIC